VGGTNFVVVVGGGGADVEDDFVERNDFPPR